MHPSVGALLGLVVGLIMPAACFVGFAHPQAAMGIDPAHLDLLIADLTAALKNMAVAGLLPINILLGGILGVLLSLASR